MLSGDASLLSDAAWGCIRCWRPHNALPLGFMPLCVAGKCLTASVSLFQLLAASSMLLLFVSDQVQSLCWCAKLVYVETSSISVFCCGYRKWYSSSYLRRLIEEGSIIASSFKMVKLEMIYKSAIPKGCHCLLTSWSSCFALLSWFGAFLNMALQQGYSTLLISVPNNTSVLQIPSQRVCGRSDHQKHSCICHDWLD